MKKLFFLSFTLFHFAYGQTSCSPLEASDTHIGEISEAYGIAVQTDHKSVVAGGGNENLSSQAIAVLRYDTNQILDNTFGTNGKVFTDLSSGKDVANDVALQSNGKIVVAGYSETAANNSNIVLVRYNTNGTLDNTFGTNGVVTTDINGGNDAAEEMAIQTDGKIVVAGHAQVNGNTDFVLVRYNPNGTLDNTFGTNGKVLTSFGNFADRAKALVLQPDGKMVVSGATYVVNTPAVGDNCQLALARYNTDGSLDNSFGMNGKVVLSNISTLLNDIGATSGSGPFPRPLFSTEVGSGLGLQSTGKIVVTGLSAIYGLNANGVIDVNFGNYGVGIMSTYINTLKVLPDDRILIGGEFVGEEQVPTDLYRTFQSGGILPADGSDAIGCSACFWTNYLLIYEPMIQMANDLAIDGNTVFITGYAKLFLQPAANVVLNGRFTFNTTSLEPSNEASLAKVSVSPNPLADEVTVAYTLANNSNTSLTLSDMFGKKVHTFMNETHQTQGEYEMRFEVPNHLTSGIYFLSFNLNGKETTVKVCK
ncbi:MAG: T9SS type A sorting domain-containing protein [Bacteroidia bacterium]